jgi:hypothetical protein
MSYPVSADGATGAVGTSAKAWTLLRTGDGAGTAAGVGAVDAAETDLEGALSLASFLTSYSAVFCVSASFAYSSGIKVILLVNCIPDITLVGTLLLPYLILSLVLYRFPCHDVFLCRYSL